MFLKVGEFELEVLGHGDYRFFDQVIREITSDYAFDRIEFREDDVVIDVGAHIGLVSIYLAKKYPVRVYAYEPEPTNFASLVMNVGANQANVIPRNLAVSADGRDLDFRYGSHSGEGGAFADWTAIQHRKRKSIEVRSTTVADIFEENEIDRCRLLKLDCEGAEHEIIAESDGWLNRVDHIRGELHLNQPLRDMGHSFERTKARTPNAVWQECEAT